ncbi:hypothetical protein BDZ85DRAFT_14525 [Elsinoe ampelina]|uniref:Uncharacterized protein n=1 Tax=Elsinoe ampelina TaxID=302913 RepID=A0A6A6G6Q1_9PEZI|nr:hypothetical protein BDZ85DRAFT_14525 [Elsinoe ampelina]
MAVVSDVVYVASLAHVGPERIEPGCIRHQRRLCVAGQFACGLRHWRGASGVKRGSICIICLKDIERLRHDTALWVGSPTSSRNSSIHALVIAALVLLGASIEVSNVKRAIARHSTRTQQIWRRCIPLHLQKFESCGTLSQLSMDLLHL